jgi:hypothetical protein
MAVAAFSSRKKRMMYSLIEHSHVRYAINAIPTVACRQINSTGKRWDIPHTQWFLVNGWCGWDWISLSNGGNQAEVGAFCRKRGRGKWPHVPTSTNRRQRNASNSHSGLATPAPKRCCSKWRSAGSTFSSLFRQHRPKGDNADWLGWPSLDRPHRLAFFALVTTHRGEDFRCNRNCRHHWPEE